MVYYQTFEVTGRFSFPLDMLRYDSCFPAGQEDACALTHACVDSPEAQWKIRLARYVFVKDHLPTKDRWASFSCSVVNGSVTTRKM